MALELRAHAVRVVAWGKAVVAWGKAVAYRVLDTVPPVRRTVDELVRVEVVDRCMVIAAQGLLALIPLVIVLAAFLPHNLTALGLGEFEDVTGIGAATADTIGNQVEPALDSDQVRAQTGVIGLVITLLSASSFALAVQRMYERVWAQRHRGGIRGRRRCLAWLFGWLVALQGLACVGWVGGWVDRLVEGPAVGPLWFVFEAALVGALWWWSLHFLLSGRVGWRRLALPAGITGVAALAYTRGSSLVMPHYATSAMEQFGTLGLVLTVATWLVGLAGVMVVAAVVGRVLTEDPFTHALLHRLLEWGRAPPASRPFRVE